jgi:DNA-binding LytR/AlgR family response regulator
VGRGSVNARDVIAVDDLRTRGTRLVARNSILYVKAYGDYVRVYADSGRYLLRSSLTDVERRFAEQGFLRVHRQYLVNLSRAVEIRAQLNGTAVIRVESGAEIPVARRHVRELRRRVRE